MDARWGADCFMIGAENELVVATSSNFQFFKMFILCQNLERASGGRKAGESGDLTAVT